MHISHSGPAARKVTLYNQWHNHLKVKHCIFAI